MINYKINTTTIEKILIQTLCSQNEFAEKIGVDKASVSHWLKRTKVPRLSSIKRMLEFAKKNRIKVSLNDFFIEDIQCQSNE